MALELRPELAEREQILVGDRPRGLEHRVVQRRRVALGEDQVVVVGVLGVLVVEVEVLLHQHRHQVGRRHRRRRVAGVGGRGGADRVDAELLAELAHAATSRSRLLFDVGEELLEGLGELLDALLLEHRDDVVVVDAGGLQVLEDLAGALDVLLDRVADLGVVLNRLDRLARHRVDRVGPGELLDVEDVAVVGVLGRGRRPQAALRARALRRQRLPVGAREDVLVGLVGQLRVGDRQLALELVVTADVVEALVDLGVDARHEEGGDRGDLGQVAAALGETLEAADVRLGDLAVALEREDQRHVDGDAGGDRLLDRGQALLRGRDLHEQVRAVDVLRQPLRLVGRALGVVGEVRVDLERDPAVLGARRSTGAARRRRPGCRGWRAPGRSPSARAPSRAPL